MSRLLFAMGVVGEDDRTPRERTTNVVRCLEEELLPPVALPTLGQCTNCGLRQRQQNNRECRRCERIRQKNAARGFGRRAGRHE